MNRGDRGKTDSTTSDKAATDSFLVASAVGGDNAALRELLRRYDRLVRYTIFRLSGTQAVRDPEWLESIANGVWTGFLTSAAKPAANEFASVPAMLARIAHNKTISALRQIRPNAPPSGVSSDTESPIAAVSPVPEMIERIDELERLGVIVEQLDLESRAMLGELPAIMERKWRVAAERLGWAESTLRSRWKQLLDLLRQKLS